MIRCNLLWHLGGQGEHSPMNILHRVQVVEHGAMNVFVDAMLDVEGRPVAE